MCIGNILQAYSYILCLWPSKRGITALEHGDSILYTALLLQSFLWKATSTSHILFKNKKQITPA